MAAACRLEPCLATQAAVLRSERLVGSASTRRFAPAPARVAVARGGMRRRATDPSVRAAGPPDRQPGAARRGAAARPAPSPATSAAGGRPAGQRAVVFAAAVPGTVAAAAGNAPAPALPLSNAEYKDVITLYAEVVKTSQNNYAEVVKTSAANYADAIKSYGDALKWATGVLISVLLAGGAAFYVLYAGMANLSLEMATAQARTSTELARTSTELAALAKEVAGFNKR